MRNSRICPENNARFFNLMCENAHRAALSLSLTFQVYCSFYCLSAQMADCLKN